MSIPHGVYLMPEYPNARMPVRAQEGDLCYDLYVAEDTFIPHLEFVKIPLGLKFHFAPGWGAIITDRSSTALKRQLIVHHGKIDNRHREEVSAVAASLTRGESISHTDLDGSYSVEHGQWVRAGERIAQLMLVKVHEAELIQMDKPPAPGRGPGWGSTGR